MKVWVLIIEGDNFEPTPSVHLSEEGAKSQLLQFVSEYWDEEMGDRVQPEDPMQAIDQYFNASEDEYWWIHECEVLP